MPMLVRNVESVDARPAGANFANCTEQPAAEREGGMVAVQDHLTG